LSEEATSSFFNKTKNEGQQTVVIASYPRSGDELLRAYLEKILGVATGSDGDLKDNLNEIKQTATNGFVGEGIVDHRVSIVSTHFPERMNPLKEFAAHRAILVVRNPIESITQYFYMLETESFD